MTERISSYINGELTVINAVLDGNWTPDNK